MIYDRPIVHNWGTLNNFLDLFSQKEMHPPVSDDWRVQKLRNLIDTDPAKVQRNLDQVCKELGLCVSARQARRLFKACTGVGIKEYRMKRRLEAAAEQLRTTDLPVKVVAGIAGYRHVSTFTKHFLKLFHLRPNDFKKLGIGRGVAA
jgi:methylphosphotriester-DNA--protein-cysteine methyltransferase